MDTLTLIRPDDWHLHLRDGAALQHTVADTARVFGRAIVMPNLLPPVTTSADAAAYRERILAVRPQGSPFEPLMTLYLTDNSSPEEIEQAAASGFVVAAKLYPAGATTHSDSGVTDIGRLNETLSAMAENGMLLLVHGEVTDADVDIFEREEAFIGEQLEPLLARHSSLKVVFEHITTARAVDFVFAGPSTVAATITAHHLLHNRNDMLVGGIKAHLYCLPVLKTERDREALLDAATSGNDRFFLGTDSAPHAQQNKESACGCAGIYTAHAALELYAEAFDSIGALEMLEGFASLYGPKFYGLPPNSDRVTLTRAPCPVSSQRALGTEWVVPLRAGGSVAWTVRDS